MGFNFSHPQKSGGAMAPLAPPSERALKTIQASDGSGIVPKTWVQIFEVPLEVLKGQVERRIFASFGFLANFDDLSKFEHVVLSIN